MPRVAFRVDATRQVGTGHLVRCVTLAEQLARRGARVVFVTAGLPTALRGRIIDAGHAHRELPVSGGADAGEWDAAAQCADAEATMRALEAEPAGVVVVDHYRLGRPWEEVVGRDVDRLVAIDDLANRPHAVTTLLDQSWAGPVTASRYDGLVPSGTRLLLGPRYALLQEHYPRLRQHSSRGSDRPRRVAVSFGGSDPTGETAKFVDALRMGVLAGWDVDLVMGGAVETGPDTPAGGGARVVLHRDLPSLADLFDAARFAVGAGGATTWERMCLGVPALVTTTADNQREAIHALAAAGALVMVGDATDTTADRYAEVLAAAVAGGLPDPPPVIDGWGARRVAQALLPNDDDGGTDIHPAATGDEPTFCGDDPDGDRSTMLEGPRVWAPSLEKFHRALADPDVLPLVVRQDQAPVGYAWVTRDADGETASVVVRMFASARARGVERRVAGQLDGARWQPASGRLLLRDPVAADGAPPLRSSLRLRMATAG